MLTYAQQSRERSNYEQAALSERMQEYKRQVDRESRWSSNGSNGSPNGDGIQAIGRSSHKMIEEVMQSAAKGKVRKYFIFVSICIISPISQGASSVTNISSLDMSIYLSFLGD